MNKSGVGVIIAIAIPLVCAVILGLLCFTQYKQRDLAQADEAVQQKTVDSLNDALAKANIEPLNDKQIAADATADEQASFLTQIRVDAQGAGVKLTQYMNMGQLPGAQPAPGQPTQPQSIYRPVASTLTVQGTYDGVRAFAYSLLRANRLMNMSGVTWKRDPDGQSTTLSFTLIRYVTDPVTTASTTKVAMLEPGSAGGAIR